MKRLARLLLACAGFSLTGAWTVSPALATPYIVILKYFTDDAALTVNFEGTDLDGNGLIEGAYPDPGCGCAPNEITSLAVSFSGNALVPAFLGSTSDFLDPGQSLFFDPSFGDSVSLIYVLDSNGTGAATLGLPGLRNGDAAIALSGVIDNQETVISIHGAACDTAFVPFIPETRICAVVTYNNFADPFSVDFSVPEPASLALFAGALGVLTGSRHRRRKTARGALPPMPV